MATTRPAPQTEIDTAHSRYLRLATERDRLVDAIAEYDDDGAGIPDTLHDERDDIDRHVLDAAEDLLGALGYTRHAIRGDEGQDRESYTDEQDRESYDTGKAPALVWESAGTCEPRDQNASSDLAPHSWWSLGPNGNETWSVELIVCDDTLTEIPTEGVSLGRFDTEQAAKDAAEAYERANRTEDAR
jgi:hypothetical protein